MKKYLLLFGIIFCFSTASFSQLCVSGLNRINDSLSVWLKSEPAPTKETIGYYGKTISFTLDTAEFKKFKFIEDQLSWDWKNNKGPDVRIGSNCNYCLICRANWGKYSGYMTCEYAYSQWIVTTFENKDGMIHKELVGIISIKELPPYGKGSTCDDDSLPAGYCTFNFAKKLDWLNMID